MDLESHLQSLEVSILHRDFAACPQELDALLGQDFREINPAGSIVTRDDVMQWLLGKDPEARWRISDYEVRSLAADVALATYHARQIVPENPESNGSRHVSLWQRQPGSEQWQLAFHQSTKVATKVK